MAHLALYRTWRPQRFAEVVGQEQTVQALQNSVQQKKTSHAYLFAGPRGTGKTSLAKILARAVNCEQPKSGEPCNACVSCRDILNGTFMDVIEIDAASNRGIDEIRDLREQVRILPAQGRKKVYIIDEVHMLTTEAFNALLKTLEEPPENVLFILATTEMQKIPPTILSRCQKYNFLRLSLEQIQTRLQEVCDKEGLTASGDALELIARRAGGGMRDALGMLDQMVSYRGTAFDREDVMQVLGIVDDGFVADLLDAVLSFDAGQLLSLIGQALHQGREPRQIARESALYLRDLLMWMLLGESAELQFVSETVRERLLRQAVKTDQKQVLYALNRLMELSERLRFAEEPRFLLEMELLGLADVFQNGFPEKPAPQLRPPAAPPKKAAAPRSNPAPVAAPEAAVPSLPKTEPNTDDAFWQQVLSGVRSEKVTTHAMLSEGNFIGIHEDTVYVSYRRGYRFHKEKMEEKANLSLVLEVMKRVAGKPLKLEFLLQDDPKYNDLLVKKAIEVFGEDRVKIF